METKYSYDFERIRLRGGGWNGRFSPEYQDVIRERAARGWRFVQAFAPATAGYGASRCVDLIFEKETD